MKTADRNKSESPVIEEETITFNVHLYPVVQQNKDNNRYEMAVMRSMCPEITSLKVKPDDERISFRQL